MVVLNSLMSVTAQLLMRWKLRRQPWMFWGERLSGRGTILLHAPLHRAAGIAGIGSLAVRQYTERFPEPRHFCIPYYCELEPFQAEPPARRAGELTFLFCGQMIARKGLDHLLAAFAAVAAARRPPAARGPRSGAAADARSPLPPKCAPAWNTPASSRPKRSRASSRARMSSSCPAATMVGAWS